MVQTNQDIGGQLASLSLRKFVQSVGARTAAPGGGSVSAAIAAMVIFINVIINAPLVNSYIDFVVVRVRR